MSKDDSNHKNEPDVEVLNSSLEPSTSAGGIIETDDEIKTTSQNIYEKIFNVANKVASTSLGQYAIEKVDKALSVVEKTAKWSLPQQIDSENTNATADKGITAPPLERPCSWLPFLTLIVALRVVRVGLSVGNILIGNEPVTPETLLQFLQTRRRKLRAIKYHGLRAIRLKHQNSDERKKRGVVGKLSSIFTMVACRPGRRNSNPNLKNRTRKVKKNQNNKKNVAINEIAQKRSLEESDESSDFSFDTDESDLNDILNRYADEKSDSDPDYIPTEEKLDENGSSSEPTSSTETDTSSETEYDKSNNSLEHKEKSNDHANSNNINQIELKIDQDNLNDTKTPEKIIENKPDNLRSSSLNPILMSPNIAFSQNGTNVASPTTGNIESFYDPIDVEEIDGAYREQDYGAKRIRALSIDDTYYSPIASPISNHFHTPNAVGDELKLSNSAENLRIIVDKENINKQTDDSKAPTENHEMHNQNNNQKFHKNLKHTNNSNNNTNTNNNRQSHYKYTKGKKLH